MLPVLFQRYKSPRQDHAVYYENEFFDKRLKPINLLQVGMDSTLQSWLKYLEKANIYCIDTFINHQPKDFSFLKEKRIFWCRCDVSIRKNVDDIMKKNSKTLLKIKLGVKDQNGDKKLDGYTIVDIP